MATPFEDFSSKMMIALTFPRIVSTFNDVAAKRLIWIKENTHKDVMVSLWKLDRAVNPNKKAFVVSVTNKRRYLRNDAKVKKMLEQMEYIELDEDQIQYYLCEAILEVEQIIHENLKNFNEDFQMPNEENEENIDGGIPGITQTDK